MEMTVAEEIRAWEKTGGNPNPDAKVLLEKLVGTHYNICLTTPDFSKTTFHPLKVSYTIRGAVEKYVRDGDDAVDPTFVDLVDNVGKYNSKCSYENRMDEIDEINVREYVNFLHLANRVMIGVPYRSGTSLVRQGFRRLFRKTPVEVPDKRPIVVMTNPKQDGLVECFKDVLMSAAIHWNRGLRFIYTGDNNGEELRNFYFNQEVKDFDCVEAKFDDIEKAYSGIWTEKSYVKVLFGGESGLFELRNDIDGKMCTGCLASSHYNSMIHIFDKLKGEGS